MEKLLQLLGNPDRRTDHEQGRPDGLPPGDTVLDSLDHLGDLEEEVEVVGQQHAVGTGVEPSDGFHGVPDLVDDDAVLEVADAADAVPGDESPTFAGDDLFGPVRFLG